MALANQGKQPLTNQQTLDADYAKNLLSVMYTCGMYNRAGEWAYRIGISAKSGVSGGIIAVVPGKAGITTFSPLIDKNLSVVSYFERSSIVRYCFIGLLRELDEG